MIFDHAHKDVVAGSGSPNDSTCANLLDQLASRPMHGVVKDLHLEHKHF